MILYFSATVNCKYVAECLSEALHTESMAITDCIREGRYDFEDETVGFFSPTDN